jgi:thymidylate synthase (FAD)
MEVKEELIGKVFPVLDDGHVILQDVMGDDAAIVEAAKTSRDLWSKKSRRIMDDRTLIRYLYRHHHGTPFEMAEIKLHVRVPMDCWRQWIRHRTANVNEYSTRYSEAIDSQQKTPPDGWRLQSGANKQGSSGFLPDGLNGYPEGYNGWGGVVLTAREANLHQEAREVYQERLRAGVAREQARKDLPLSTYTEAIWKCDLRNVLHFLGLRMDSHAQQEIRDYATVIGDQVVAPLFPLCWEAFRDYTLGAMTLSAIEIEVIARIQAGRGDSVLVLEMFPNQRELDEFKNKARRLGIWPGEPG